jgi:hypothetical protein
MHIKLPLTLSSPRNSRYCFLCIQPHKSVAPPSSRLILPVRGVLAALRIDRSPNTIELNRDKNAEIVCVVPDPNETTIRIAFAIIIAFETSSYRTCLSENTTVKPMTAVGRRIRMICDRVFQMKSYVCGVDQCDSHMPRTLYGSTVKDMRSLVAWFRWPCREAEGSGKPD